MCAELIRVHNVTKCTIIQRLNRFVVKILVRGRPTTAHINNTGRLRQYIVKGKIGYCVDNLRSGKTEYRVIAINDAGLGAIIDTRLQMRAFEEAINRGLIPWIEGYRIIKRDVKLKASRIDYLLGRLDERIYVEVKSALLRWGEYAAYPDCPTSRGRRHISEITEYVLEGGRGAIVFLAAMPHVEGFKPYPLGEPVIPKLLRRAQECGVLIKAISMHYDPDTSGIYLDNPDLKVRLT